LKLFKDDYKEDLKMKTEDLPSRHPQVLISVMLAVPDAPAAVRWYKEALGASELWNLGGVAGLEVAGGFFFVGEPEKNGWESPGKLGITTARIEVFCDDPDTFIDRAVQAGADGSTDQIKDHEAPWGIHRQGGFIDPFGHIWLVGDRSPLLVFYQEKTR
jgi:PhnB protein